MLPALEPMTSADPGPDPALAAAVDVARTAAAEDVPDTVGEHLGVRAEVGLVATHFFAATLPGYAGWRWAVSVARIEGSDSVTIDEVVLLPGDGALLAPEWVPWGERVRPGDLGPGDLLPPPEDDIRLVPGYVDCDDAAVEAVAWELGLGRERVLSRDGRLEAADRWYTGDHGPDSPMARQAPARCGTCGFFVALAGSLSAGFGACANDMVETDGQVVSVEFGCGAHSQVTAAPKAAVEVTELVYDDGEELSVDR